MKSNYNTPPVWSIYILNLTLQWVEKQGGIEGLVTFHLASFPGSTAQHFLYFGKTRARNLGSGRVRGFAKSNYS